MAKGDKKKVEKEIDAQKRLYSGQQEHYNPLLQSQTEKAIGMQDIGNMIGLRDYGNMMSMYGNMAMGGGPRATYNRSPEMNKAFGGYSEFADTGGYSPADVANMRARGVSPIRAVYANAQSNIDRQRRLQGGYSPNYTAASSKMARELSSTLADKTTDLEGNLAEMKQRGRLAGLGGLAGLSQADAEMALRASMANQDFSQNALRGMTSLYGTTPAMAELFGRQASTGLGQEMEGAQQGGQFGLGLVGQRVNAAQLPSNFETAMGRVGTGLKWAGKIAPAFL